MQILADSTYPWWWQFRLWSSALLYCVVSYFRGTYWLLFQCQMMQWTALSFSSASKRLLVWLTLWPWIWKWYVPARYCCENLGSYATQWIAIAVKTLNMRYFFLFHKGLSHVWCNIAEVLLQNYRNALFQSFQPWITLIRIRQKRKKSR
jgi:hypothetical protein